MPFWYGGKLYVALTDSFCTELNLFYNYRRDTAKLLVYTRGRALTAHSRSGCQCCYQVRQVSRVQGTLPQIEGSPWTQKGDHRHLPDALDRYLEHSLKGGALFRCRLSYRQTDGTFCCDHQSTGIGTSQEKRLHLQR